jgi:hypothetical protein
MPLNPTESYEELSKYEQFYASFHSAYELSSENFIKVPPKTIIVSTFNDNSISSLDQISVFHDMILNEKDYLVHSLLTENDDIPEYHKFHDKTIYMPGSCIPNIALEFIQNKNDIIPLPMGITNIKKLYNDNHTIADDPYGSYTRKYSIYDFKTQFVERLNKDSIVPKHLENLRTLTLKDVIQIIHDYDPDEYGYLIFIDGCSVINYGGKYLKKSKISIEDRDEINQYSEFENILRLSSAYTKYNRDCVLDSLQKFTDQFTFYDIPPSFFKYYPKYGFNFDKEDAYKTKYKKELKYVNKYATKLPDRRLSDINEDENDIYYNKSRESVGTAVMSSNRTIGPQWPSDRAPDENLFEKYFDEEVTQILYPPSVIKKSSPRVIKKSSPKILRRSNRVATRKSPRKLKTSRSKSPRKIKTVRRSSRLASSRNVYDGRKTSNKRRKKSKRKKY